MEINKISILVIKIIKGKIIKEIMIILCIMFFFLIKLFVIV